MNSSESVLEKMAQKYNQLYLTPEEGISSTGVYSDIVRCGKLPQSVSENVLKYGLSGFICSDKDMFFVEKTPAGFVNVLYIYNSADFERFIQIMAYRGEPVKISPGMNSAEISGITNWRRIEAHMKDYLNSGGDLCCWKDELNEFIKDKSNYQDRLIIIRNCKYSGMSAMEAGFTDQVWEKYSMKLMLYHSLSHVVIRNMYPEIKNILWNEIAADCTAMLFTFGKYSPSLAKRFMGVSKKGFENRGRLAGYCFESPDKVNELAVQLSAVIDRVGDYVKKILDNGITGYYDVLVVLQEKFKAGFFEQQMICGLCKK